MVTLELAFSTPFSMIFAALRFNLARFLLVVLTVFLGAAVVVAVEVAVDSVCAIAEGSKHDAERSDSETASTAFFVRFVMQSPNESICLIGS